MTISRSNGFLNLVETLKRKTRMSLKQFPRFPSLLITATDLIPQGTFAEAQAQFLDPDRTGAHPVLYLIDRFRPSLTAANELGLLLKEKRVGVVAHFYMDAEVLIWLWS